MKNIKLIFATLLMLAVTTMVFAQRGGNGDRMIQMMTEQLDLTETQVTQVTSIHEEFSTKYKALRDQASAGEQVREEMKALNDQRSAAINNVLTDAQITKWKEVRSGRKDARPTRPAVRPEGSRPEGAGASKKRPKNKAEKLSEELGISNDEAMKVLAINKKYKAELGQLKEGGKKNRKKAKKIKAARKAELLEILTAEQLEKFQELRKERKGAKQK